MANLWEFENEYTGKVICGVDEAGRGPLAGTVVASAVILPFGCIIDGLDDSKKLSEKKREKLYDEIIEKAVAYCIASASVDEIEQLNILNATFLAMKRAIDGLNVKPDIAFIDGNRIKGIDIETKCIVGGDGKSANIAAASILAKVTRDRYMKEMAKEYPEYSFEKHKGYGTKVHCQAILEHGPCPIHRISFLGKILNNA